MNKLNSPIIKEMMMLPTENYWVTFTYSNKKQPEIHLYFSFPQFDVEP